jgi:hypothetical protein
MRDSRKAERVDPIGKLNQLMQFRLAWLRQGEPATFENFAYSKKIACSGDVGNSTPVFSEGGLVTLRVLILSIAAPSREGAAQHIRLSRGQI